MDRNEKALQVLIDTVASTAAMLASRMTLAMYAAGASPNKVAEWMKRYTPLSPSFDPSMAKRINQMILDTCLKEIELYHMIERDEDT